MDLDVDSAMNFFIISKKERSGQQQIETSE